MSPKPRIAVVSPFLDKQHGTERTVVEQLERLAGDYEFHVFSTRVDDLELTKFTLHRVPTIGGPAAISYLWFLAANHVVRWWDRHFYRVNYDLTYSPGINCLDADVMAVHVLFSDMYPLLRSGIGLARNSFLSWPRMLHRRVYYLLASAMERRVYPHRPPFIVAVSHQIADGLTCGFSRKEDVEVIYAGIDTKFFNPRGRLIRRKEARERFGFNDHDFVLLLIGNGWRNKGLLCVLRAMNLLSDCSIKLLVVGKDDRSSYKSLCRELGLEGNVSFLDPSHDVLQYYAASEIYVGPSLYDSFALPPAEAMACGQPVIVSRRAGVSELITDGSDGFILEDPSDSEQLARLLRLLYERPELRVRLGEAAARTASKFSWDENAARLKAVFDRTLQVTPDVGIRAHSLPRTSV